MQTNPQQKQAGQCPSGPRGVLGAGGRRESHRQEQTLRGGQRVHSLACSDAFMGIFKNSQNFLLCTNKYVQFTVCQLHEHLNKAADLGDTPRGPSAAGCPALRIRSATEHPFPFFPQCPGSPPFAEACGTVQRAPVRSLGPSSGSATYWCHLTLLSLLPHL